MFGTLNSYSRTCQHTGFFLFCFFKFKVMTQLTEELSHSNRSETASLLEGVQLETVSYAQFKVFK